MQLDGATWVAERAESFLRRVGLREGQTVVDFGCNTGNYALAAAQLLGSEGKVYAVDKDRKILHELKREAGRRGLDNVTCLHIHEHDGLPLPRRCADVVLLYDVLHGGYFPEAKQRAHLLRSIRRVLKLNGVLSLYPTHLRMYGIGLEELKAEVNGAGFRLQCSSRRRLVHDDRVTRGWVLTFGTAKK